MKISFKILLLITCTILQLNGQQTKERWDGYMAAYEEGKIGSTTLRMDLIDTAPIKDLSKGMYFIANVKDSDVPIGCLLITYEWDSGNNAFIWWIQDVFVDEKWRRKGVYQSMHKHVVNTARERGNVFSIKLHVNHNNLKAQKTYQKMGMTNTPNYMYELPL